MFRAPTSTAAGRRGRRANRVDPDGVRNGAVSGPGREDVIVARTPELWGEGGGRLVTRAIKHSRFHWVGGSIKSGCQKPRPFVLLKTDGV